jgi:hypothetical protein
MMTLDLTDDETAALARLLQRTINDDRYPLSHAFRDTRDTPAREGGRSKGELIARRAPHPRPPPAI